MHRRSCPAGCRLFPDHKLNPSPALAGRFFTTEPPGKPGKDFFFFLKAFVTARQSVLTKILLDQTLLPELFLKKLSATFYSFNLGCTGSPLQCLGLASGCGISFPDQERNPALGAQCQPLAHQGSPLNSFPTRRSLLDFCDVSAFSSLSKNCSPDPVCLVTAEV